MQKIIFLIIASLLTAVIQIGLLPGLGYNTVLLINLPLFFIVFIIFFNDFEFSLISAVFLGMLLDLYSNLFFGLFILIFLIEVLTIRFFLGNIFEHKGHDRRWILVWPDKKAGRYCFNDRAFRPEISWKIPDHPF